MTHQRGPGLTQEPGQALPAIENFRARVTSCWLGKAVGGTLGAPWEGASQPLDLDDYDPVPDEMLPNDDLDLQVLWAAVLQRQLDRGADPKVDRHDLSRAFLECVDFPFDEYGVAIRNMRLGLRPPFTGSFDNYFTNGMGAAIRSEVWACLAAGDPALAALYAREDAVIDHAGPGIEAEMFFAALEADAFTKGPDADPAAMTRAALAHIPEDGITARAIRDALQWWDESGDWREVRAEIVGKWGHENFTDTTQNVAFTILGWLAAPRDFGRAICIAVNCGLDTDCTGATLGALMGILDPDCIGDRWLEPIGRQLVVSPEVRPPEGTTYPPTIDAFTDQVIALRDALGGRRPDPEIVPETDVGHLRVPIEIEFADWRPRKGYREHFGLPPGDAPCPEMPDAKERTLAGTYATLEQDEFEGATLLMRFTLELDRGGSTILMFNSPQPHRVWLGDEMLLGREAGRMAPSLHRAPLHQWAIRDLPAGEHKVTVSLTKPERGPASWVIAAGDPESRQWLPGAFRVGRYLG